jgi:serine/threonine protein kinase
LKENFILKSEQHQMQLRNMPKIELEKRINIGTKQWLMQSWRRFGCYGGANVNYNAGDRIYKYELINKLGSGGFAPVWKAADVALRTVYAIKILDTSQYSIDERLLEAQIGNRLQHPNVVNIKNADVVSIGNPSVPVVIIAMPVYSNGSVASRLNSANFLDLSQTIKCLVDVLRGLEYLHENGYYHCDIKPNNILVGDKGEYLLSDYGITCYSPDHTAIAPRQCYIPHISSCFA